MDLDELYRLMRGAHVQAQAMVDTVRDPLLVLDDQLNVVTANAAFYDDFRVGRQATVGENFFLLGDGQWNVDELRLLLEQVIPKSASVEDYEVQADFAEIGPRTMLVSARRLARPDLSGRALMLTLVDATERRRQEARTEALTGELEHRLRNLVGVVQALVRQTGTRERSAEEYRDVLSGRLEALGRSLSRSLSGEATRLGALVADTLGPHLRASAGVAIEAGPEVALSATQALAVGMILHELCTNAAKHGALSTPGGQVRIGWSREGEAMTVLRWRECGGPAVTRPETTGFGARLIRHAAHDIGGEVAMTFAPEGVRAELRFPPEPEGAGLTG